MSAYLWGNLLGRLIFSWLVVWLFAMVFKKRAGPRRPVGQRLALGLAIRAAPFRAQHRGRRAA